MTEVPDVNRQVVLVARPDGIPAPEHFAIRETPVTVAGDGEMLVRNLFLSVDPAQRGYAADVNNYVPPVPIDGVMRGFALGNVVASRHPDYTVGARVMGMFGWQDVAVSDGSDVMFTVPDGDAPLSAYLGILGFSRITAFFGLLGVGKPAHGETVVVSTAAGSVGSAVGQIAKINGCRAVGITGGPEKVALCTEAFGYDAAVDYKADGLAEALAAACPDGVDVYFDNTGGAISDTVLAQMNIGGRIVVCGTAATSSWDPPPQGPRVERTIMIKRLRMQGFVIFDYRESFGEAQKHLADWLAAGDLSYREHVLDGIEHAPSAIQMLYQGQNMGKLTIRL